MLVKVRKVQDDLSWSQSLNQQGSGLNVGSYIRDEASLKHTQQCTAGQERSAPRQPELAASNDTPEDHLSWDPSIRAYPLGDELRWKL